ncbi:hypothetical protein ACQUSR_18880 [Streptomyces sp. P1-3]|uniref:hypothetical protein n=1 Tax=Streptomyces sp. P1-3 TaxID=3421658 RepID=UPI003D36C9DF
MSRMLRFAAIGTVLGFSCLACTSGESGTDSSAPPSLERSSRLQSSPEIALSGDPLAGQDIGVPSEKLHALAEFHKGPDRIIVYTQGEKCGLSVVSSEGERTSLQVLAAWPKTDDAAGSSELPFGPYAMASAAGSGASRPWASLSCGKDAMVVEYTSQSAESATNVRGAISVAKTSRNRKSVSMVVGPDSVRKKIGPLVSSAEPARS